MTLQELKIEQKAALDAANAIVTAAESGNRGLTATENEQYQKYMDKFRQIGTTARAREEQNTILAAFGPNAIPKWVHDPNAGTQRVFGAAPSAGPLMHGRKQMSEEYNEAFMMFIRSNGKQASSALSEGFDSMFGGFALPSLPGMSAAAYEGSSTAGGAAVSVPTDNLIVPLARPDLGVRSVARVIATATDIKIPSQSAFSTAAIKAESGASTNTFTSSDPTLNSFTLSAFMIGLQHVVSFELMQDVNTFQAFSVTDLLAAVDILEDSYFVTGTGTNQPQGLSGNVGTGTGSPVPYESTGAYLLQSTLDVVGTLKAVYHPTASWLMNRQTGAAIRKAQLQSNLFAQVWTRENGRDYLHGYPVTFSSSMPNIPTTTNAGTQSILFGSFSDGYVIGDRGGSGTFVKVLDQPLATAGQIVLLGYKRVDGRVRRSEAVQGISISHS